MWVSLVCVMLPLRRAYALRSVLDIFFVAQQEQVEHRHLDVCVVMLGLKSLTVSQA